MGYHTVFQGGKNVAYVSTVSLTGFELINVYCGKIVKLIFKSLYTNINCNYLKISNMEISRKPAPE